MIVIRWHGFAVGPAVGFGVGAVAEQQGVVAPPDDRYT